MRRLLAAAVTAALLVPGAAAQAAAESGYRGGCAIDAANNATTAPPMWTGALYVLTALHSESLGDNPVSATVTCQVRVNGVAQGDPLTASGTGVVVAAGPVSYAAAGTDLVELCETVDFTSDDTPTVTVCDQVGAMLWDPLPCAFDVLNQLQRREPPPPPFCDLLQVVIGLLPGPGDIDALVCALTGGADVYVLGELFWDCPPYETEG